MLQNQAASEKRTTLAVAKIGCMSPNLKLFYLEHLLPLYSQSNRDRGKQANTQSTSLKTKGFNCFLKNGTNSLDDSFLMFSSFAASRALAAYDTHTHVSLIKH